MSLRRGDAVFTAIGDEQQRELASFLCYWLGTSELYDAAFDLGVPFELFAVRDKEAFAAELVRHLVATDRLGCLQEAMRSRAPEAGRVPLPPRLPACVRHRKLLVRLPGSWTSLRLRDLCRTLARAYKVPRDQVMVVGAAGEGVRILVSLPDTRPSGPGGRDLGAYRGAVVCDFESLTAAERRLWRRIVCRWPPQVESTGVRPVASWERLSLRARRVRRWSALVLACALVGGVLLAYLKIWPRLLVAWARLEVAWKAALREARLWSAFWGSVALSAASLSWITAAVFAVLALSLHYLPALLHRAAVRYPARPWLARLRDGMRRVVGRFDRVVGTGDAARGRSL